jgi:hypothetical protein
VQAFPADVYRFPALADVTAALVGAGFTLDHKSERDRGPMLLLATKSDSSFDHDVT